ncbi:MAG: AbrB/MazE/SpoVT family DNA-binding domain-containing protein [Phototrophicales bacterium]|nr:MAG: AbrB/MazE/SpoVT family DNA-binding domain-containing protein [Phototrophicales bacterium]
MQSTIQRWGNSLALRIPKVIADELGIAQDAAVEIFIREGQLVVVPIKPKTYSLEAMLAAITDENRHDEIDTGFPIGNEV